MTLLLHTMLNAPTLNLQPSTPQPSTFNLQRPNLQPSTPQPSTFNAPTFNPT
ncbi:hypothetical protein [Roseiflexus sp. RS-1]|uniref:hypothetical protein n=1 Tax=Roseiflexus sp. (strain RS-1) TaxID=357808 RepID=UPI0002E4B43F|nr:hypothetical protein [Roseiflexus sp. RS-1]